MPPSLPGYSLRDGQQTFLQLRPICMKRGARRMRCKLLACLLQWTAPGDGFSADGAVRKEQRVLRSCRDAARDSAMCPMAGRAAGMASAAFQKCSIMSERCPPISDIPRQLLHSAEAAFPDMPGPAERGRGPGLPFGGLYGGLEQPLPAHACLTASWYRKRPCRRKRHEVKPVSDEARAQYTSANAVGRDLSEGTLL